MCLDDVRGTLSYLTYQPSCTGEFLPVVILRGFRKTVPLPQKYSLALIMSFCKMVQTDLTNACEVLKVPLFLPMIYG